MRKLVLVVSVVAFLSAIIGCDTGTNSDSITSPIGEVTFMIDDRSEATKDELYNNGVTATAYITFYMGLVDGADENAITSVTVTDSNGAYWNFNREELNQSWRSTYRNFGLYNMYTGSNSHQVSLGNWTITVEYRGATFTETISVFSDGLSTNMSGSVRSATGTGGVSEILGVPSVSTVGRDGSTDTFTVDMTLADATIDDAFVWFYTASGDYLGVSGYFEEEIGLTLRRESTDTYEFSLADDTTVAESDIDRIARATVVVYDTYSSIGATYRSMRLVDVTLN